MELELESYSRLRFCLSNRKVGKEFSFLIELTPQHLVFTTLFIQAMRLHLSLPLAFLLPLAYAHMAPFTKGMYCLNVRHHAVVFAFATRLTVSLQGTDGTNDQNTNDIVNPLYNLTKADWWSK
jgi:hypothetical protein